MQEEKRKNVTLPPNRFHMRNSVNTVYTAEVEAGITQDDLLRPDFWAHVSGKFRPRDIIIVHDDEDMFYAELLVLACDKTWAQMHLLRFEDISAVAFKVTQAVSDEYDIKLRGPKKWSVIRKKDNAVIYENLRRREDAVEQLKLYLGGKAA
jgi:hypothetical protein